MAGLIFSVLMLPAREFGRATAIAGLMANGLRLGHFVALVAWPALIGLPIVLSAPFRVGWYLLIAHGLWRSGSASWQDSNREAGQE